MPEFPSFDAFYRAANEGRKPFPWQSRLAARVSDRGWPELIGIPTGMGKTACIDIAVWELARQGATGSPADRSAPTRVWYVVNRRLLVDLAERRALALRELLAAPHTAAAGGEAVIRTVADALRAVRAIPTAHVLHVSRLRGGADLGQRPLDPSHPALILATVPMFASRLLFRGYGSSTGIRPVDAGLAGMDSLVLLDEAHLAGRLSALVGVAARCDLGDPSGLLPEGRRHCRLVALTATGEKTAERFDLDDEDRRCPEIQRRLSATKPVEPVETTIAKLADVLAHHALARVQGRPGSACIIFCNTATCARKVWNELGGRGSTSAHVQLVTGRMREREARRARDELLDPVSGAPAGRDPSIPRARSLVVVATQTLEVGADLDFDFLVSEVADVRAVTQRFGRLNRLGLRPHAGAVLCRAADAKPGQLYGEEPERVWARLSALTGRIDLTPGSIGDLLGPPSPIPTDAGELLPDHLWELAKTSFPEPDEPPVELFFEGREFDADVSIVWRSCLPAAEAVKVLPIVRQSEAVDVPLSEVRSVLNEGEVWRLAEDRATAEKASLDQLRPGDVVILSVDDGLYDEDGWNAHSSARVLDVSLGDRGMLWLDAESIKKLLGADPPEAVLEAVTALNAEEPPDAQTERELVAQLLAALAEATPHPWMEPDEWREAYLERFRDGDTRLVRDQAGFPPFLLAPRRASDPVEVRAESLEELSFGTNVCSLADHQEKVSKLAGAIARRVGLPPTIVAAIEWAAAHHDLGKQEPRFRRWLDPECRGQEPLAKSSYPPDQRERFRIRAEWPRGGRHELLSVRLLAEHLTNGVGPVPEVALALHLVASHHGHGRPSISVVPDARPPSIEAELADSRVVVSGDVSIPDWEQPRRFRSQCERHGVWGLALIEAVLRQADQIASGPEPRPDRPASGRADGAERDDGEPVLVA